MPTSAARSMLIRATGDVRAMGDPRPGCLTGRMTSVLVNGPASWNMLVDLEAMPEPRPHMQIARGHRWGLGGTSAGKALDVVELIMAELRKLKEAPLTEEELKRAKDQLKGNLLLGLESSTARMANLARQEMYFHQFFTVDELIARVDEVDAAQVQAMARRLFDPEHIAVTLLGRLNGVKLGREMLVC